jgi:hypothetical protein
VWLLFPPTEQNLRLWADNRGEPGGLSQYGAKLEGGIIAQTSRDLGNAITLSSGCIHAVFTIRGGFLCGINYSTKTDLLQMSRGIAIQLKRNQDRQDIRGDIHWYKRTLLSVLSQAHPDIVPIALYSINQLLIERNRLPKDRIKDTWNKIEDCARSAWTQWKRQFATKGNNEWECTCGATFGPSVTNFTDHYSKEGPECCKQLGILLEKLGSSSA